MCNCQAMELHAIFQCHSTVRILKLTLKAVNFIQAMFQSYQWAKLEPKIIFPFMIMILLDIILNSDFNIL